MNMFRSNKANWQIYVREKVKFHPRFDHKALRAEWSTFLDKLGAIKRDGTRKNILHGKLANKRFAAHAS